MKNKIPDSEKLYWQNRERNLQGATKVHHPTTSPSQNTKEGWLDIEQELRARVFNNDSSGGTEASLVEGHPYYVSVKDNFFGHTTPLFKKAGIIGGPTARSVFVRNEVRGVVVDDTKPVDLSKINPEKMISLVEITVPYLGTFLVAKESVISKQGTAGRQILKG